MGLPDRTGDPGDSEFARPNIPSSIHNGSTPGSSEKYGTDHGFPFVDHVACFLCNASLNKAQEEGRKFWLTSCCHVLCSKHDHEKGRCTSCGKTGISVHIIDKEMPMEMRAFIEKGDVLLERYEKGVDTRTNIVRALKYQSDQLSRTNKLLQKQLNTSQARLSKSMGGIQEWQKEKAQWEKEKAEYEVQIVNLKNIIEVNNKELPSYPHLPSAGLGRIQEDGDGIGRPDMVGHLLGKRPRIDSSPRISLPASVGRLSLPTQGGASISSHESNRSAGPGHMAQLRTNLDQLKYRPGSTVPQTPGHSNGYNNGDIVRPGSAMPFPTPMARGPVAPYPNLGQTPRPVTLVDRLRQNGRTDRDDSPLRPSSALQYQQAQEYQSPAISRAGTPVAEYPPPNPIRNPNQGHALYPTSNGFVRPAQRRF